MYAATLLEAAQSMDDVEQQILSFGEQFMSKLHMVWDYFQENSGYLVWNLIVAVLILMAAKGMMCLVSRLTKHAMHNPKYHRAEAQGKRVDTLMTLLRSVARYVVYFVALLLILYQFGFDKSGGIAVAFAGVGSVAVGFGAQNLVKDVVTGLFMMFENQFAVGDYIKTDEAEGTVVATAMRVTYLRSLKGDQIVVPNGSISRVVNYTRGGYVASVTISTAYEADTRSVIEEIREAVTQYAVEHEELIVEPPVVLGITNFGDSSVDIGVSCKVKPMKQWEVERGMRLAVKERFDERGVEFPYPHVVTVPYAPQASAVPPRPSAVEQEAPDWANAAEVEDD